MSKSGNLAALTPIFQFPDTPILFYGEEPPYLPRVLVLYWSMPALGSMSTTSRIRITILTAAGFVSFPPFQLSPSSAYYQAVHKLPEEKQRDEVIRGVAFSLLKYFGQLSPQVKNGLIEENFTSGFGVKAFGQQHAADIASRLNRVANPREVLDALRGFVKEITSTQQNALAPSASIRKTRPSILPPENGANGGLNIQKGGNFKRGRIPSGRIPSYSQSAKLTPRIAEEPQHPTTEQKEALRYKMCEFVDTEERYISKLHELAQAITDDARDKSYGKNSMKSSKSPAVMFQFPGLVDHLSEINTAFLEDLQELLEKTEESALANIGGSTFSTSTGLKDEVGAHAFSKLLLHHFPNFLRCYREYLDIQPEYSAYLRPNPDFQGQDASSLQRLRSMCMEPVQRISRYSLLIDAMTQEIPASTNPSPTARNFAKARDIIADICAMEPSAAAILASLRIQHESETSFRTLSPTKLLQTIKAGGKGTIKEAAPVKLKEDKEPKLLPSLGSISRSMSKKSRFGLHKSTFSMNDSKTCLLTQNATLHSSSPFGGLQNSIGKAAGHKSTYSLAENVRPPSSFRPNTNINSSSSPFALPPPPADRTTLAERAINRQDEPRPHPHPAPSPFLASPAMIRPKTGGATPVPRQQSEIELKEEIGRLQAENAELRRQARNCTCHSARIRQGTPGGGGSGTPSRLPVLSPGMRGSVYR